MSGEGLETLLERNYVRRSRGLEDTLWRGPGASRKLAKVKIAVIAEALYNEKRRREGKKGAPCNVHGGH